MYFKTNQKLIFNQPFCQTPETTITKNKDKYLNSKILLKKMIKKND